MTLTQEQFDKLRIGLTLNKTPVTTDTADVQNNPNFFERVGGQYKSAAEDVTGSIKTGAQMMQEPGIINKITGAIKSGLGTAGGVARAAVAPIVEAPLIKQSIDAFSTGVQKLSETKPIKAIGEAVSPVAEWALKHPEAAKSLQDIIDISSLGITKPAVKSVENVLKDTTGAIVDTTANVTTKAGSIAKGGASKLYKSAITPNTQEAEKILASKISGAVEPATRASTALEKGITGTQVGIGVKSGKIANSLYKDKILPAIEATKDKVSMNKSELFALAEDRIARTIDPSKKTSLQTALDAIKEDYKNFPGDFDLVKAQSLKRDLDRFTPSKIFRGQDVANEVRVLNNDMANAIRRKTYDALADVNIKKDYLDYGNLIELQKIGVKALTEAGRLGGSGQLVSYLYDKATVPVKTIGGKVLYRVGNMLEFVGNKGLKTFGEFLNSKGVKVNKK